MGLFDNEIIKPDLENKSNNLFYLPDYKNWLLPNSIKYDAKLQVPQSTEAIFITKQQPADVFTAGEYLLNFDTLPKLSDIQRWYNNAPSSFKAKLYFVDKSTFEVQWQVNYPMLVYKRNSNASTDRIVRLNDRLTHLQLAGVYDFHIADTTTFVQKMGMHLESLKPRLVMKKLEKLGNQIIFNFLEQYEFTSETLLGDNSQFNANIQAEMKRVFALYGIELERFALQSSRCGTGQENLDLPLVHPQNEGIYCWSCQHALLDPKGMKRFSVTDCDYCDQTYRFVDTKGFFDKRAVYQATPKNASSAGPGVSKLQHFNAMTCPNCRRFSIIPPEKKEDHCTQCNNPQLIDTLYSLGAKASPTHIAPFQKSRRDAELIFSEWLSSVTLLSKKTRNYIKDNYTIKGIFVPVLIYDLQSYTYFHGQRGIRYRRGDNTYTDWTPVKGQDHLAFNKQTAFTSNQVAPKHLKALNDFFTTDLLTFSSKHIQQHAVETYEAPIDATMNNVLGQFTPYIARSIKRKIGGDRQQIDKSFTSLNNSKIRFALVPVWIINCDYSGTQYEYVIGGRKGKLVAIKHEVEVLRKIWDWFS